MPESIKIWLTRIVKQPWKLLELMGSVGFLLRGKERSKVHCYQSSEKKKH